MATSNKLPLLNDRLAGCVRFARFAAEYGIDPRELAELLRLADRAFNAGERECNTSKSADPQRDRFEAKAKELGFGTEWNGLYPTLIRADATIYLPEVS